MEYSPKIEPYLDAIQGCESFIVAEREYGKIVNYIQMGNDVFPDPATAPDEETAIKWRLRRQCRGMIFDHNGDIISLPYHKFFNVEERTETLIENIDMTRPHIILEKLDGSMVRPIPIGENLQFRMGTKMGITEVAMQSEVFVAEHQNYQKFIMGCIAHNYTPIFEWCSRKQRIVIDYPKDRVVLTAIRSLITGEYKDIDTMKRFGGPYNIELVKSYDGNATNMESLLAETADIKGQEGWVIRFNNGEMYKIKGTEYVLVHHAKENILREKGVIEMLLDEKADDVKAFLPIEDINRLNDYETAFWKGISETAIHWAWINQQARDKYIDDRKSFALEMAPHVDHLLRGKIFKAWDNPDYNWREAVIDCIRNNLGTQAKVDETRHLWGNVSWGYNVKDVS